MCKNIYIYYYLLQTAKQSTETVAGLNVINTSKTTFKPKAQIYINNENGKFLD